MRTYAYIDKGEVREIFVNDSDIYLLFNEGMLWVDVTDQSAIPQERWSAHENDVVWTFSPPQKKSMGVQFKIAIQQQRRSGD